MCEGVGHRATAVRRNISLLAAAAACLVLAACAGARDIPPLRPDLPSDLRQAPPGSAPDFNKPPPRPDAPVKTQEEKEAALEELETLRETHENSTRRAITGS